MTTRLARLAAVTLGLATPWLVGARPAAAEILWRGDFETADLSQYNEFTGPVEQRFTIVEDPVRQGMYAGRMEIRPGDLGNGNLNRVEIGYHPPLEGFEGSERWYAFSAMQDPDAPLGASWHAFAYWEADVLYTGTLVFGLFPGNELRFDTRVGDDATQFSTYFEPGVWHDFVLHVVWSADPAVGLVELWYDGEQVVAPLPIATMHTMPGGEAATNFFHIGMIRDETLAETEVLFYDGVLEATEAADVMGGGDTTGGDGSGGTDPTDATDPTDPTGSASASGTADSADAGSVSATAEGTDTASATGNAGSSDGAGTGSGAAEGGGNGGCACAAAGHGAASRAAAGLPWWLALGAIAPRRRRRRRHA